MQVAHNTFALSLTVFLVCGAKPLQAQTRIPERMHWIWHGHHNARDMPIADGLAVLVGTIWIASDGRLVWEPRFGQVNHASERTTWLVVRIEVQRGLSADTLNRVLPTILQRLQSFVDDTHAQGLQIDFDCPRSLRSAYVALMRALRTELSTEKTLSMTALGSWCLGDRWLDAMPSEILIVPMMFGTGHDLDQVRAHLRDATALPEPRCNRWWGILAGDVEPASHPQVFVFTPQRRAQH